MAVKIFKGAGEIWTSTSWKVGMWPRCELRLTQDLLEFSVGGEKISVQPQEVDTARFYQLPMSSLTVIAQVDDGFALLSFSPLRITSKIVQAFEQSGFQITETRRWRTGFEAGKDGKQFQLEGSR